MKQIWHDLLFAHWPIPEEILRPLIPSELSLDIFDTTAWLGIVPFHMSGVRLRLTPEIKALSTFPELNVRTYVTFRGEKPGVYFFSLDAANRFAVWAARFWYQLPYYCAEMSVKKNGEKIHYSSLRQGSSLSPAVFRGQYEAKGEILEAKKGSLEYWLTERYCLYTSDKFGRICRAEINHLPWKLQEARLTFEENSMIAPLGITLPPGPPLVYFSKYQDVEVWPLQACS